jgi:hypothetical protein
VNPVPHAGDVDDGGGQLAFARRFRRHAMWLMQTERSPLCAQLMLGAAADIESGGRVAALFDGVDAPPGAVPQLRLLAALHELALAGDAPELAEFYPSAGGTRPPDEVWPAAAAVIDQRFAWMHERVGLTVQTNEPGRAAVLYAALLWLTAERGLPIRLLEIGSSAGLNLLVDRYCYVVAGRELGDPGSALRLVEPWAAGPPIDVSEAARALRIVERAGCDLAPLDPGRPEDQVRLLSYIWPDELDRIERVRAALAIAAAEPLQVAARPASAWLEEQLRRERGDALTVVWHSIVRQYVPASEWDAVEAAFGRARGPIVWLSMEPSADRVDLVELTARVEQGADPVQLAWCAHHGPPLQWLPSRGAG